MVTKKIRICLLRFANSITLSFGMPINEFSSANLEKCYGLCLHKELMIIVLVPVHKFAEFPGGISPNNRNNCFTNCHFCAKVFFEKEVPLTLDVSKLKTST